MLKWIGLRWLVSPLALLWFAILFGFSTPLTSAQQPLTTWSGSLASADGKPVQGARIVVAANGQTQSAETDADGHFLFPGISPGPYALSVQMAGLAAHASMPLLLTAQPRKALLTVASDGAFSVVFEDPQTTRSGGGEQLSSSTVSAIPLNKRDFSALLLLAAGTSTDANGATNFTQQFAINGQRGVEATFAMDGADTSDPELGGATFSNFNVDAIQSIDSSSGWMPAEIGRGASGFTNISTRSGSNDQHGSFFEFLRNSSLDSRNYFDHSSLANPGRIPPFRRNEFGLTNGGAVIVPHLYDGRNKTFYFVELQGFRQVLGTTQVFPVPTSQERAGVDATAFPGDPLIVPVQKGISEVLARYPLPNYPQGAYGVHTYATSAKIVTDADQFSVRFDQQSGAKNHFFARVSFDNLLGPVTNPDQTVLSPSFGIQYRDHQRNVAFDYARTASARLVLETQLSIMRTTPAFHTNNTTDPAVKFNDGLFESFNAAAGSVAAAFNNLFSLRQAVTFTTPHHVWKAGAEVRLNRDTSYFGMSPNGEYDFGGGTAYSPVELSSQSGAHVIHPGDPLPDTLSSFLLGSPFVYTVAVAPPFISSGQHIGPAATSRNAGGAYVQDTWKLSERLALNYGIRYERYSPIEERARRTSSLLAADNAIGQVFVVNPQPPYQSARYDWAPRVQLDVRATQHLHVHAGGGLTTIPPNIWQDNMLTGGTPFVIYPRLTSTSAAPVAYGYQITSSELPRAYTPAGADIFPGDKTTAVAPNTVFDVDRYERELAAVTPSDQITPLNVSSIDRKFGNAYLGTWTLGLEQSVGGLTLDANYIGTAAMHLARVTFPNAYPGADAAFARHTEFDSTGKEVGGFGTEQDITSNAHSTYHALQTSLQGTIPHGGPGLQASYTWSKSIDDVSSVAGASAGSVGSVAQVFPQNPFDTHAEKGPSTFDTAHLFTLSLAQDLALEHIDTLRSLPMKLRAGWELLSISTITSGSPFTVYSGVQQTGAGANGVDRPDQIAKPDLTTTRAKREDYFGRGENNGSFFSIPIGIPGGTGPNQGRFGTLGRDTFRGPAYYDFDFSLIKDTAIGRRKGGGELVDLQFRSEFFNIFNIVNMGLPASVLNGSGFGEISRTAGTSRQIQFSLKVLY